MTSQTSSQTITVHILRNISQSRDNQTMKFGELIQNITREIFFFENLAENEAKRLTPKLFFFF